MRILQVIDSFQIGGAEVLLRKLIPLFLRDGHEVDLYLLKSTNSSLEKEVVSEGISVKSPEAISSVYSCRHIFYLARYLQERSYDIIHVHLFPAQLWVAFANKIIKAQTPIITTEHNTYNRRRKKWFRPLDRWMYSMYDSIVAISEATAHNLIKWLPELDKKMEVIHNGINTSEFAEAVAYPKEYIVDDVKKPLILFVGRFTEQKDHKTLIKAMVDVPDAHLILVGDGSTKNSMEAMARVLNVHNRVHFLGRRKDIPQLLKMSDVYVQSSHWEGFGIAVLEAMAGGLPVIASNVPGLRDVVGNSGILFNSGDSQQLAKCINTVLKNKELYNDLAKKSRERALEFNIEKTAKQYTDLYQRVINSST